MRIYIYGHHIYNNSGVWINRVRLPVLLVVSSTRKMKIFPCPRSRQMICPRETDSAVQSSVSLLILFNTPSESGAYSQDSSRFPQRRPFIYITILHRVSPELIGHAIAYRWRSLPRVRRLKASSPQCSSNKGCCLYFTGHHGPIN